MVYWGVAYICVGGFGGTPLGQDERSLALMHGLIQTLHCILFAQRSNLISTHRMYVFDPNVYYSFHVQIDLMVRGVSPGFQELEGETSSSIFHYNVVEFYL